MRNFGKLLEQWLSASFTNKRARRMLLSVERNPSQFIELRFLPLAHAAELLSKATSSATIVNEGVFEASKKKMLAAIADDDLPDTLIESLANSLGWANNHGLKGRILSVLAELEEITCMLFASDKKNLFLESLILGIITPIIHQRRTKKYYRTLNCIGAFRNYL